MIPRNNGNSTLPASRQRQFNRAKKESDAVLLKLTKAFLKEKDRLLTYQKINFVTDEDTAGLIGKAFNELNHEWQKYCKKNTSGFKMNPQAFKQNVEANIGVKPVKPQFNINDLIDDAGNIKPTK